MGLLDFIYGPRRTQISMGTHERSDQFTPIRCNIDDLRNIVGVMQAAGWAVQISCAAVGRDRGINHLPVELESVDSLAQQHPSNLELISLTGESSGDPASDRSSVGLVLHPFYITLYSRSAAHGPDAMGMHESISRILVTSRRFLPDEGHAWRAVRTARAALTLLAVVAVALLAHNVWIFGIAVVVGWLLHRSGSPGTAFMDAYFRRAPREWLELQSRSELRRDRANRKANTRVALVSGPLGALVGAAATWWLTR